MTIDVRGVGTHNRGAELMLDAIVEQLGGSRRLAIEIGMCSYDEVAARRMLLKFGHARIRRIPGVWFARGKGVLPARAQAKLRSDLGLVFDSDIDAIVDASGFAYGDQWGPLPARLSARDYRRARAEGKPVILMPQAFGPFENPAVRDEFRQLCEASDLIYAREQVSFDHALAAGCPPERLRIAPDFTVSVSSTETSDPIPSRLAIALPSHTFRRMSAPERQRAYLPLLAGAVKQLRDGGHTVWLMAHDETDSRIIPELQDLIGERAPVIEDRPARELKSILGAAEVVVGSRFHGLVGALSQTVPSVGIGWSHKYGELFGDFDCREYLLGPDDGSAELEELIERVGGEDREPLRQRLRAASDVLDARTKAMWEEIASVLDASGAGVDPT